MGKSDPYGINVSRMREARFDPQEMACEADSCIPIHPAIQMDFSLTVFWMGNMKRAWEKETRLWHGHH